MTTTPVPKVQMQYNVGKRRARYTNSATGQCFTLSGVSREHAERFLMHASELLGRDCRLESVGGEIRAVPRPS